jgi:uncharacterized membrane protein
MWARLVSAAFLAASLVYAGILAILHARGTRLIEIEAGTLNLFTVALVIAGAVTLLQGFAFSRRMLMMAKNRAHSNVDQTLYNAHILRSASFEAVSIYGLMLGIMGAMLPVVVTFFAVSLGVMVATFPTGDRWRSMRGELSKLGTGLQ